MATEKEKLWLKRARAEHGNQTTQDKLESERDRHLATLKRVEWGASGDYQDNDGVIRLRPCCPECMCWKHDGWHEDDCKLAADLKRLEGLLK